MQKFFALMLASVLFLLSCAHTGNLTDEQKQTYHKAKQRYDWGQRGGP
jgi:hypothetical protein